MRPLDSLPSIKFKLGSVIVAAIAVTVLVMTAGSHFEVSPILSAALAGALALALVHFLARGMTSPLRDMAAAAGAMARRDYRRRVIATSRDEVGELARAFNAMAAELEELDRERKDLVANVSHELRTPISALQAVLENLVDGVEAPDPAMFSTMLAQVERLGRLVTQLLDLSRLESGAIPLQRCRFEVSSVLEQVVSESRLHAPGHIRLSVAAIGPLAVEGDPERVHQVIANLVENAVRHSPAGGAVEVSAHADGDRVAIEVSDEGPGIPDEEVSRVFERFYRSDQARSSRDGGAGLGLAIARWIVDLHGGEIRPERREPHGCRMVVMLPG